MEENRANKLPALRSRKFPSEAKVEISLDAFSHAGHHLIGSASRWRSSDSSAPSRRPGHNASGLMRRWRGEPLIAGPPVLCLCQISDGHGPLVSDECYGVGTFGLNASLLHIESLSGFSVNEGKLQTPTLRSFHKQKVPICCNLHQP